jgi:hypothetical protein
LFGQAGASGVTDFCCLLCVLALGRWTQHYHSTDIPLHQDKCHRHCRGVMITDEWHSTLCIQDKADYKIVSLTIWLLVHSILW